MRAPLVALASALAGCGALTDFQTAATLPPGGTEVGLEVTGFTVTEGGRLDGGLPTGAVVSRHGVDDGFELGLRLGTMGAEVTGKWLLVDGGVRVAVAPTVGGFVVGAGTWWAGLRAPVLVEVPIGAHGLVFSPRAQAQYVGVDDFFGSGGGTGFIANAGLGVGFALALGPVVLMPEVAAAFPFSVTNTRGETAGGVSDEGEVVLLVQGGIGARWRFD